MKIKKILFAAIIFILLAVLFTGTVSAAIYESGADELKSLGLFIGTNTGYELDREPTRAEAAVLLVRLLGKEAEAKKKNFEHPFTDVPEWASPYIGYLYVNKLTNGISADKFGPTDLCSAKMFCAFVLRALGYTEGAGDFTYDEAVDFAMKAGIIDDDILSYGNVLFNRDCCVIIMRNALLTKINGKDFTLLEKLAAEGAVDKKAAENFMNTVWVLVREVNNLLASSFWANPDRAYSVDFELVTYWDKTAGSINVIGDDYAVFYKYDDYYMNLSEYRKDGYIYKIIIDREFPGPGEKIKYKAIDSGIPYTSIYTGFRDVDASKFIITGIEKIISGKTVVYKYTQVFEKSVYGRIEESGSLTFDSTGKLIYESLSLIFDEFEQYNRQVKYTLKGTGDKVKIKFPDFKDYIGTDSKKDGGDEEIKKDDVKGDMADDTIETAKDKKTLVDEVNKLLKSAIPLQYSMDFETVYDDFYYSETEKMTGTLSVMGDDYAVIATVTSVGMTEKMSEYGKDGYIYTDYWGEKEKYQADYPFDGYLIYDVPTLNDFGDFDMPADEVESIEKTISGGKITYKIIPVIDYYSDSHYIEGFIIFTFNLKGELVSVYAEIKEYYDGQLEMTGKYDIKITATGNAVKINFPDFSDYIEE